MPKEPELKGVKMNKFGRENARYLGNDNKYARMLVLI